MEDIVINHVPSNTVLARDIVIDLLATPPYTAAVSAKFYWRFEDEPESDWQPLVKQTLGFPVNTPFDGVGRTIRLSMISAASNGAQSTYDPREGVQTTVYIPSPLEDAVIYGGDIVTYNGEVVTYA